MWCRSCMVVDLMLSTMRPGRALVRVRTHCRQMEQGIRFDKYDVLLIKKDGTTEVFASRWECEPFGRMVASRA